MKDYGSVTDGVKTYKTVVIGTQTWMAENLNYDVPGSDTDVCYNNDPDKCAIYGRLYDWATAMALDATCNSTSCAAQVNEKHRGICPSGWHLPSDDEWTTLTDYAGGSSIAGKYLMKRGGVSVDKYGFSALPGGAGGSGGSFIHIGYEGQGFWWSSSEYEYSADGAYYRSMDYIDGRVYNGGFDYGKSFLFSVRCVQD